MAQTTDFATVEKTVDLPKGFKIDPKLRLKKTERNSNATKAETDVATDVPVDPAKEEQQKAAEELDQKLIGAWTLVTTANKKLSNVMINEATRRCLRQMKLKPLAFENSALQELPDIDRLFGDIVYYRTERGLQRLDVNSGSIVLFANVSKNEISRSMTIWRLKGRLLNLRLRFANDLPNAPKARFMLEEAGLYLRCAQKH